MGEFEFQELIDNVTEIFQDVRNDAKKIGENNIQAMERFFYEYDNIIHDDPCEAAIICATLCIELYKFGEKTIHKDHYVLLSNMLNHYSVSRISESIDKAEIEILNQMVKDAIIVLNNMEIIS